MNRRDALLKMAGGVTAAALTSQITSHSAFADGGSSGSQPSPPPTVGIVVTVSPSEQYFTVTLSLPATPCPAGTAPFARIDTKWSDFVITGGLSLPLLTTLTPNPARIVYTPNSGSTPTSTSGLALFQADPAGRGPNTKFAPGDTLRFDIHYRFVCRAANGAVTWVCRSFRYTITMQGTGGNLTASIAIASISAPADCDSQPPVGP